MGMMLRRNKLRRLEQEKQANKPKVEPVVEEKKESVKDTVPEVKRRKRKPKE